jgi:hypothetical protein
MSKLAHIALFALAITTLPAVAADPAREPRGTGSPQTTDASRQQCQKYQGTERDECMQGKRTGQMGQHPALPDGGTQGRQEVPGTGTTVPK